MPIGKHCLSFQLQDVLFGPLVQELQTQPDLAIITHYYMNKYVNDYMQKFVQRYSSLGLLGWGEVGWGDI